MGVGLCSCRTLPYGFLGGMHSRTSPDYVVHDRSSHTSSDMRAGDTYSSVSSMIAVTRVDVIESHSEVGHTTISSMLRPVRTYFSNDHPFGRSAFVHRRRLCSQEKSERASDTELIGR